MNMKRTFRSTMISLTVIALSALSIAAGVPARAESVSNAAMSQTVQPPSTSSMMAPESSNSLYAYSTEAVGKMNTVQIGGEEYQIPLTMEKLEAGGWKKAETSKTQAGQPCVVKNGDMQLSVWEDGKGQIEKIIGLYTSPGALEIPGKMNIKTGISEGELEYILDQYPLSWQSAHFKNGTTKYKMVVPLGGQTKGTGAKADAAKIYPAFESTITVSNEQVRAIELRMVSDPGADGWTNEVLGFRAAAYYEKMESEMPPLFRVEEQEDGTVLIRLFEDFEDHIATWAIYKADRTGSGYDVNMDPEEKIRIDFMGW